jgi:hypothetical protein
VNVNKLESLSDDIDSLPTIDVEYEEGSALFKLENAFTWVVHECYKLQSRSRISRALVTDIESRIQKVFLKVQYSKVGEVKTTQIMKQDQTINPHDKYLSISELEQRQGKSRNGELRAVSDSNNAFGDYDYSGKRKTKDEYAKYVEQHNMKPLPKGSMEERSSMFERDREQMMEVFKRKWSQEGGVKDPYFVAKRDSLKSKRNIAESEIKRLENERARQLQDTHYKYQGMQVKQPIQRSKNTMGVSITERDLQRFEAERRKMLDHYENRQ